MRKSCVLMGAIAIGYVALGAQAPPAGLPVDPLQLAEIKDFTAHRVSSNNPDLNSNDDSKRPIPGETVVLADLTGPGVVTHIWLTVAVERIRMAPPAAAARLLRRQLHAERRRADRRLLRRGPRPRAAAQLADRARQLDRPIAQQLLADAVQAALPHYRHQRRAPARLEPLLSTSTGRSCRLWPPTAAYFHARYRQALPAPPGKPLEILNVKGRGHYVGTVFSVVQTEAAWFGEGDDFFYVDGKKKADIEGTGTEDYFNDAWSFRVNEGPYTGVTVADGTGVGARMSAYRWHIRRSHSVHHQFALRHRACRLEVQPRWFGALRVRGAARSVQHRRVLVSARHRHRSAGAAVRRGAPAARQRETDRDREPACGRESHWR